MEAIGPLVIIATYRRPAELRRLLDGLEEGTLQPKLVVVADNAASADTVEILAQCPFPTIFLPLPDNPGPGAAWKAGAEKARSLHPDDSANWLLFCDDDIVVGPHLLEAAWRSLESDQWDLAAPMLTDSRGKVWGFPEPLDRRQRRIFRQTSNPDELCELLGTGPHALCWATGACLFVKAEAIANHGSYRTDFFMLGEDLEFSMRVASGGRAVFYPEWVVPHSPMNQEKEDSPSTAASTGERRKFLALLQNLTFLAFHSPHSRHMGWYLPGNYRRFQRTFGGSLRSWKEMLSCFWAGSVLGQPSGCAAGRRLRESLEAGI
jgi:GT2 family glycosyltransferase